MICCFHLTEAVVRRCSVKKIFLNISQNSQENTCARGSFLIKLQSWNLQLFKREILAQVFSCEFCNYLRTTFLYNTSAQWTHLRRFAIELTSKNHVESSWKLHRFWMANPRGNYDIDSTWIFQCGFDFQIRRNIDEFSTWRIHVNNVKLM